MAEVAFAIAIINLIVNAVTLTSLFFLFRGERLPGSAPEEEQTVIHKGKKIKLKDVPVNNTWTDITQDDSVPLDQFTPDPKRKLKIKTREEDGNVIVEEAEAD